MRYFNLYFAHHERLNQLTIGDHLSDKQYRSFMHIKVVYLGSLNKRENDD